MLQAHSFREWLKTSPSWHGVMITAAICNVTAEWPQAWQVWHTRHLEAVSPSMFWTFLFLQVAFAINAWAKRDPFVLYSGSAAALATTSILIRIYMVQYTS